MNNNIESNNMESINMESNNTESNNMELEMNNDEIKSMDLKNDLNNNTIDTNNNTIDTNNTSYTENNTSNDMNIDYKESIHEQKHEEAIIIEDDKLNSSIIKKSKRNSIKKEPKSSPLPVIDIELLNRNNQKLKNNQEILARNWSSKVKIYRETLTLIETSCELNLIQCNLLDTSNLLLRHIHKILKDEKNNINTDKDLKNYIYTKFLCSFIHDSSYTLTKLASNLHEVLHEEDTNANILEEISIIDAPALSISSLLTPLSSKLTLLDCRQAIQIVAERKQFGQRSNKKLTNLQKLDDEEKKCLWRWEVKSNMIDIYLIPFKSILSKQKAHRTKLSKKILALSDFCSAYDALHDSGSEDDSKLKENVDKITQILVDDEKVKLAESSRIAKESAKELEKKQKEDKKLAETLEKENKEKAKLEIAEKAKQEKLALAEKAKLDKEAAAKLVLTTKKEPVKNVPSVSSFFQKIQAPLKPEVDSDITDTVSFFKPLIRPWYHDPNWKVAPIFRRMCNVASFSDCMELVDTDKGKIYKVVKPLKKKFIFHYGSTRKAPFYGTYSHKSKKINGRHPLRKDNKLHDYDADSEDEELENEPVDGEYLNDDDDEDDEEEEIDSKKLRANDGWENDDFVSTDNESDSETEGTNKKRREVAEIIGPCYDFESGDSDTIENLKQISFQFLHPSFTDEYKYADSWAISIIDFKIQQEKDARDAKEAKEIKDKETRIAKELKDKENKEAIELKEKLVKENKEAKELKEKEAKDKENKLNVDLLNKSGEKSALKTTKPKNVKAGSKVEATSPVTEIKATEPRDKVTEITENKTRAKKVVVPISISDTPAVTPLFESVIEPTLLVTPKKTIIPELIIVDIPAAAPIVKPVTTEGPIAVLIPKKKVAPVLVTPTKKTPSKATPGKLPQNITPITSFFTKN